MTDGEIWLYLLAAFCVGLGLGWWLFSGARGAIGGSAEVARKRVAPAPEPEPQPVSSDELDHLKSSLQRAQAELETALEASQSADSERVRAEREVAASKQRLVALQANLDRARESRDTLRDEVSRARRTIQQLERAADEDRPTASLAFTDSVPPPPDSPSTDGPSNDAPSADGPEDVPRPPLSLAPTAKIEAPPPPRPKRGPIDVLFGPLGGVPLTTSARSIPWELTIRLNEVPDGPSRISDVQVTLRYDLEDEGVAINGRRRGPITLSRGGSVTPSRPLHVQVSLSTGYHSDTPEADRPPAVPGDHSVVIVVQYHTDRNRGTPAVSRFSARIPVSAPNR